MARLRDVLVAVALLQTSPSRGDGPASALDVAENCARSSAAGLWPCLTRGCVRAAGAALLRRGEVQLFGPYLSVVPDAAEPGPGNASSAPAQLPAASSAYAKLIELAGKRSVRVTLPGRFVTWLMGATAADGARGKKDKGAGVYVLGGVMMMTTLVSTAFGALALMAAKGLMTSVLALMLSAMAVSKKSGHGGGHARTTYEVINGPAAGYKLEHGPAVVSDVDSINSQYNSAPQTEPIQFNNQQYD